MARLYVKDGYPSQLVAGKFGISKYSIYGWSKRYRLLGEQGLMDAFWGRTASKLPESVTQSIIELGKKNLGYGARRITDILNLPI